MLFFIIKEPEGRLCLLSSIPLNISGGKKKEAHIFRQSGGHRSTIWRSEELQAATAGNTRYIITYITLILHPTGRPFGLKTPSHLQGIDSSNYLYPSPVQILAGCWLFSTAPGSSGRCCDIYDEKFIIQQYATLC